MSLDQVGSEPFHRFRGSLGSCMVSSIVFGNKCISGGPLCGVVLGGVLSAAFIAFLGIVGGGCRRAGGGVAGAG